MNNFDDGFLIRCRAVTNYYERIEGSWSPKSQLLKVYEEVGELQRAKSIPEILEEGCDTILSVITLFDLMDLPHDMIKKAMEDTLNKVETRAGKLVHANDGVGNG